MLLLIGLLIGTALGVAAGWWWRAAGRLPAGTVVTISLRPEPGRHDEESAQGVLISRWGRWVRLERATWLRSGHDPHAVQGTLWVPRSRVQCVQLDPELQEKRS